MRLRQFPVAQEIGDQRHWSDRDSKSAGRGFERKRKIMAGKYRPVKSPRKFACGKPGSPVPMSMLDERKARDQALQCSFIGGRREISGRATGTIDSRQSATDTVPASCMPP